MTLVGSQVRLLQENWKIELKSYKIQIYVYTNDSVQYAQSTRLKSSKLKEFIIKIVTADTRNRAKHVKNNKKINKSKKNKALRLHRVNTRTQNTLFQRKIHTMREIDVHWLISTRYSIVGRYLYTWWLNIKVRKKIKTYHWWLPSNICSSTEWLDNALHVASKYVSKHIKEKLIYYFS